MLRSLLYWLAYRVGLNPRGIFVYYDGRKWRYGDPLVMARSLWSIAGYDSGTVRMGIEEPSVLNPDGVSVVKAYGQLASIVRSAFDLRPVEDGGLTEFECRQLLDRFESYLGELKKNSSPMQTGPDAIPEQPLPDISGYDLTQPTAVSG